MSVTFTVQGLYTGRCIVAGFSYETGEQSVLEAFPSYEELMAHVNASGGRDAVWTEYDWYSTSENLHDDQPSVNMSNANARDVMMALGLDFMGDLSGVEDASTFHARVLLALATDRLDDASPAFVERGAGGATLHYGGRAAGYVNDRLVRLLEVAEAASRLGVPVVWS